MFRPYAFSSQLRLPSAKAQHARWLSVLKPNNRWERRILGTQKIYHSKTFESLYIILDSRSTFMRPWKNIHEWCGGFGLTAADGLIYPGPKFIRYGRKKRNFHFTMIYNGLCMGVKEWSLFCELDSYIGVHGEYGLGREDNSPLQPHMWEIPKGTTVPSSLRLTTWRRKSQPDYNTTIVLGPAVPMSLDCLNQNLEKFMQDSGRVTPLRQWFTPEEEFCKECPQTIDFIRQEERCLKERMYKAEVDARLKAIELKERAEDDARLKEIEMRKSASLNQD